MAWVFASILLLVLLIAWAKLHPFLAFLLVSVFAGIALGLPGGELPRAIEHGIGSTLGPLVIIVVTGAMFGKLVAESGAAQKIAAVLVQRSGTRHIGWALMLTGFIAGIPLFYNVGFVLLIPLVFSVAFYSKLPAVHVGLPLCAALSAMHGFLPPHPSPTAMVPMLGASLSTTLLYGIVVAVPAMVLAGPVFARAFRQFDARLPELFVPQDLPADRLPGAWNSFATALLPVALIAASAAVPASIGRHPTLSLLTDPSVLMVIALLIATWTLGLGRGRSMREIMESYAGAVKDISIILLIVAGAGTLKQVFVEAGVSAEISAELQGIDIHPLALGWMIATVIRVSLGSATVAGLTAAGIVAPLVASSGVDPNLMVLAIGAGSLMLSHVNDSGFWMFKEYFNLTLKQTLLSWTLMEGIIGVTGLAGVLVLDALL
jgi:Gnt-I system high-affinity gluconate transporter